MHEYRAPKLLHEGRARRGSAAAGRAIQGRRVGEWLGKHRSASAGETEDKDARIARASISSGEMDGRATRRPDGEDYGRVAQKGRALVSHTRGRWFEPSLAHLVAVAQPVDRPSETRGAAGSIPAGPVHTGPWLNSAEFPAATRGGAGSTPAGATRLAVGELVPRRLREPEVAGSSPAGRTFDARWGNGAPRAS